MVPIAETQEVGRKESRETLSKVLTKKALRKKKKCQAKVESDVKNTVPRKQPGLTVLFFKKIQFS